MKRSAAGAVARIRSAGAGIALAPAVLAAPASAQESNLTPGVTAPAAGRISLRTQYRFARYEGLGRRVDMHQVNTTVALGLTRELSASVTQPTMVHVDRAGGGIDDDDSGLGDTRIRLSWRFWQHDPGGLDTTRAGLFGGVEIPTGTGDLSSHSFDPYIGVTYMIVRGRHGFNVTGSYQFNTGTRRDGVMAGSNADDLAELRAAYLYRVAPGAYTSETTGSWYALLELETFYETGGDTEVLLSPGVLYEGLRWAGELGVRVPVARDVNDRLVFEWGVYGGLRFLF